MDREAIITTFERCFPGTQTHTVNRLVGADFLDEQGLTVESAAVRRGESLDETCDTTSRKRSYKVNFIGYRTGVVACKLANDDATGYIQTFGGTPGTSMEYGVVFGSAWCSIMDLDHGNTWGVEAIEQDENWS